MKIKDQDNSRIEAAVKAAEAGTRGEIVVVLLAQSQAYRWTRLLLAGLGATVATAVTVVAYEFSGSIWHLTPERLVLVQCGGALLGWMLSSIDGLRRRLVPAAYRREAVHKQALAEFTRHGVMNTNDRCGILLLVSLFEHQVELVADQGIHSHVGTEYWEAEIREMAAGLRSGQPLADVVIQGVERLGKLLADKFPRTAETINELGDRPRV